MKSRDVIVGRYHVVGKIIPEILGFELASFLDKKSNAIYCVQIWGFFEKSYFGNWASVIFGQKNPEHILVRLKQQYKNKKYFWKLLGFTLENGLDFLSRNDASSNPRIKILKFSLDFLSKNDASSNPRNWIFCPEFTDRG